MVHSVVAVPSVGKIKRERRSPAYSESMGHSSNGTVAQVLERAQEDAKEAPMSCVTTTYGREGRMRTFFYQPREYHL